MPEIFKSMQVGASLARRAPPRMTGFEPIPEEFVPRRPAPFRMDLSEIVSTAAYESVVANGRFAFHCFGDSGGVKRPESQGLVARGLELSIANEMTKPSFCYHLGDVVYYTGQVSEYWPQFYEPYERYPLPIVGIPGNHDGERENDHAMSLEGFYRNFVAAEPETFTRESRDSGRPAGVQPWFYWTLSTPCATIIGLYSNVPEGGRLFEEQRQWFQQELADAPADKAVIVALHHPIYSFDDHHSGSSTMAKELQDAINVSRRVPNMVLAAHVHNYQRIEGDLGGRRIPFLVMGNGGYWNLHYLAQKVGFTDPETGATLVKAVDSRHGFMTLEIGPKVINGHFTTVPRPQESWSDPNGYNSSFDVFSYSAAPIHLAHNEVATLLPEVGTFLAPVIHA